MRLSGRIVLLAFVAVSTLLLSSCSSYRVSGFAPKVFDRWSDAPHRRYRIAKLTLGPLNGNVDTHYVFGEAAKCSPRLLVAGLHSVRPDVFSDDPNAFPIDVDVSMVSSSKGGEATILLYIFSLCTLPFFEDFYSEGLVRVTPSNAGGMSGEETTRIRFVTNKKFTFYSPIGWLPFDDVPEATAVKKGSVSYSPPENDLQTVFLRTTANAVVAAVGKLDLQTPKAVPDAGPVTAPPVPAKPLATAPAPEKAKAAQPVRKRPVPPPPMPQDREKSACRNCGALLDANGKCPLCD